MTDDAATTSRVDPFADPGTLRDRDDVAVEADERDLPPEKFDALRERYEQLAGVTQFGITDGDGAVLLAGEESYAPLGGNVRPDEDWVAATERAASALFDDVDVRVDRAAQFERTTFRHADDPDQSFPADSVLFEGSVVADDPTDVDAFLAAPSFAADLEHPMYGDDADLAWFDAVTDDVHENHVQHVESFLD